MVKMWINLNRFVGIFIFFTLFVGAVGLILRFTEEPYYEIKYDCREAETTINFPIEVKDRCQRLKLKLKNHGHN